MYQSVDGDVNEPQQFVSLCTQPLIYTIQCQKWFIWFLPKPVLSLRGDIWFLPKPVLSLRGDDKLNIMTQLNNC